jgi:hypothetical protein
MNNKEKVILSACGLALTTLVVMKMTENSNGIKEYFGMLPGQNIKVFREAAVAPGDFYSIPSNYQANISPRFDGTSNYGPLINYDRSANNNYAMGMGALPATPLGTITQKGFPEGFAMQKMARDQHNTTCDAQSGQKCNSCGQIENYCGCEGFTRTMNTNQLDILQPSASMLAEPAAQMSSSVSMLNELGETIPQPIIYDRFVYANQKSRTVMGADFIRGDLPIVPEPTGWMRPPVNVNTDLRSGALMSMGGVDLSTTKALLALKNAASGGTNDVGSGINYAIQKQGYTSAAGGDVSVVTFP